MQIVVGIGILACAIFVCSAAVSGVVQGSTAIATPTASAAQSQPTSAPTQAPTPTPTNTVRQNIIQIVDANTTRADKIVFAQNDGKTVIVQITLSEMLDQGDARNTIQQNCYNIEKALWTAHIKSLEDVNLAFRGPSQDKYGNQGTSPYGMCDLTKATAAKFNWDNLDSQSAWQAYDQAQFFSIIEG